MERDLRAVKDKATSSEQLVSVRERRWRKGLEESQAAAVEMWRGAEQGSLEVGIFRDWRALSCFGSRVDVEVEIGVVGVLGVGAVEGLGAEGECVGEITVPLVVGVLGVGAEEGVGAEGEWVGEIAVPLVVGG